MFGRRRDPLRVVYVPHGYSEKRQAWAMGTAFQDVAVLHGQAAYDQLEAFGVAGELRHWLYSGNLRSAYYERHAAFFRARREALGVGGPAPARTLLYAPTWQDAIGSSSFFDAFAAFVDGLPSGWRLVVKLHPHLERRADAIDALAARCRGRDVRLVRAQALCYPFLDVADAYVGDMSSLAYDYLAYNRPMFFTNPTAGAPADAAGSRLFACGTVIAPERYADLYRIVDDAWADDAERYGAARAALDAYVHAPGRDARELAFEMEALLAGPAPAWMGAAA
jgi:CDP-glycerol glycerophosphotransferase (TagB/SpsB family)